MRYQTENGNVGSALRATGEFVLRVGANTLSVALFVTGAAVIAVGALPLLAGLGIAAYLDRGGFGGA